MRVGQQLKILTQRESQPDPNVKHHFYKKEIVTITMIATDGIVTAESEGSGEWDLEPKDFVEI